LYGLRRSPLLWQKELTKAFNELGFKEVPQEPCVALNGGVIAFFYVDDIVLVYRKRDESTVRSAVDGLEQRFQMTDCGELKWFLGIHVVRDRKAKSIWLSQESYFEKIVRECHTDTSGRLPETPMDGRELLPSLGKASAKSTTQYQKKIGSILFAAVTTRLDIAFAAARLSQFCQNPNELHHEAADRVIRYLYSTRDRAIWFDGQNQSSTSFVCASDASFADNTQDRKSSQGYVLMLFGGAIAWKANKQDTVTTSSTEAELLAISQTAKEAIFMSRLFKALTLELDEPLVLQCDNRQTIRLVCDESAKLQTKLRHVDIHNHWLRQECMAKRIHMLWKPTADIVADGLTKALAKGKFNEFIRQLKLQDIAGRLEQIKRMEVLREQIKAANGQEQELSLKTGGRGIQRQ
jgi:hypothetical protein